MDNQGPIRLPLDYPQRDSTTPITASRTADNAELVDRRQDHGRGGVLCIVPPGTHLGQLLQAFELRRQRTSRHRYVLWMILRGFCGLEHSARRDSMAGRPIEILTDNSDEDPPATPQVPNDLARTNENEASQAEPEKALVTSATAPVYHAPQQAMAEPLIEPTATEPVLVEQHSEPLAEAIEKLVAVVSEVTPAADIHAQKVSPSEGDQQTSTPPEPTVGKHEAHSVEANQPRTRKPKGVNNCKETQLSALDAAVKVLEETGQAMTCHEMIVAMAAKNYWTSPGGKTPQATLYSAIAREITAKGVASRFVKAERGKFARNGTA
jgi:hypothetical protein